MAQEGSSSQKLNVLSLFTGAGGLDYGFEKHDAFEVRAAYDPSIYCKRVYDANFGEGKYQPTSVDVLLEENFQLDFYPDVVIGGPPCQDFSMCGSKKLGDRANLTLAYRDIVLKYRPTYFCMENVESIKSVGREIYDELVSSLKKAGYGVTPKVVRMWEYGVPQTRKRLILIGKLDGKDEQFANKLDAERKPIASLREYFDKEGIELEGYDGIWNPPRSYTKPGVLSLDALYPTVRCVSRSLPKNYKFHANDFCKDRTRVLVPDSSMTARIQTYPRDFTWPSGYGEELRTAVGNSVPPLFSQVLARIIAKDAGL